MNPKNLRAGFFVLLMVLTGCAKQEEKSAVTAPEPPKPPTVELVKNEEQSRHFLAVNRHLELGGTLYGYVDVDGDANKVAGGLQDLLGQIAVKQPMVAPYAKQDWTEIFQLLGLDDIKAMGVSSVPDGHGYFRNRAFFYTPDGRHGLLAGLGGKPAPFAYVKLAPAATDFYAESEIDLPVLYQTIRQVIAKISGEPASNQLEATLQKAGESASLSVLNLIYGLKGHAAMVLCLDPQRNLRLPVPPYGVNLPAFSLLICIDGVGPVLEPMLAKSPAFKLTQTATQHIYELVQPLPLPGISPVFVREGSTFYVATSREFLTQCREQKTGLAETGPFRRALAQVGTEGNGLTYVSPQFFTRIRQVESLNPMLPEESRSMLHMVMAKLPTPDQPLVTVRSNLPDGILVRSHLNRSMKQQLAMVALYPVSVGLVAAMAIPAFQKVRQASQQKAVQNNLRQFAAAGDRFCLENGVDRANYNDLVGPDKFIKVLNPVAGETYRGLIYVQGHPLRVRLANGQVVEYKP